MLPLLCDRLRIVMTPNRVSLVRLSRGLNSRETQHKSLACIEAQTGQPLWQPALQALQKLLTGQQGKADATVVLSSQFVRYVLVPAQADLSGAAEEEAYVRFCFSEMYGQEAAGWALRWGGAVAFEQQAASAIDAPFIAALEDALKSANLHVSSIQPYLMSAFNLMRQRMNANQWFVLIESGRACVAHLKDGVWNALHSARLNANWQDELPKLLEREFNLADAGNQPGDCLLCVPQHIDRGTLSLQGWNMRMSVLNDDSVLKGKFIPVSTLGSINART